MSTGHTDPDTAAAMERIARAAAQAAPPFTDGQLRAIGHVLDLVDDPTEESA